MAFTIDNVTRLPGTAGAVYAQGSKYDVTYEVTFHGGYDESGLLYAADDRLPKIGWYLGEESGATSEDLTVCAQSVRVGLKPGSLYGPDDNGIAVYVVNFQQVTPQFAVDPLERKDVQWSGGDVTEVLTYDANGKPFLNSAGQPYTGLPARPIRSALCNITIRQKANPAAVVTLYSYTTNSAPIWGVDPGNALMGKITAKKNQEGSVAFWELSLPIQFRRDGWKMKLIDNGFVFLDADGNPQTVTDDTGNAKPSPVLLDGSGGVLAPAGAPVTYPSAGFDIYESANWGSLGLPNPFADSW